ncbi:hypothetical protein Pan241w_28440 [Gimesia alba]|uniref:Uncharacterized protein n=1 Tax=Gimesia alba TaxID=2527973 RepID=A0A517RFY7_9PLAN|nr:hypothetical protein Pan241w_28440 [Gimesia alba]
MKSSCHRLEIIKAPERVVVVAAKSWWQDNGFTIHPPVNSSIISSFRGSGFGLTDQQTKRIMEIILKPIGDGTAVSVYHHTNRILCVVGVMFGNILERETENFLQHIREYVSAKC